MFVNIKCTAKAHPLSIVNTLIVSSISISSIYNQSTFIIITISMHNHHLVDQQLLTLLKHSVSLRHFNNSVFNPLQGLTGLFSNSSSTADISKWVGLVF